MWKNLYWCNFCIDLSLCAINIYKGYSWNLCQFQNNLYWHSLYFEIDVSCVFNYLCVSWMNIKAIVQNLYQLWKNLHWFKFFKIQHKFYIQLFLCAMIKYRAYKSSNLKIITSNIWFFKNDINFVFNCPWVPWRVTWSIAKNLPHSFKNLHWCKVFQN